jgi:hypothetical protein
MGPSGDVVNSLVHWMWTSELHPRFCSNEKPIISFKGLPSFLSCDHGDFED